jgi:hypothetical protein
MYSLASINPPVDYSSTIVDLNTAYGLSLEITRYTLLPPEQFIYSDNWTNGIKDKNGARMSLTYVLLQYHVLITKPEDEVHKERLLCLNEEAKSFLKELPRMDETFQGFRGRSETWITLFSRLVEMLRAK